MYVGGENAAFSCETNRRSKRGRRLKLEEECVKRCIEVSILFCSQSISSAVIPPRVAWTWAPSSAASLRPSRARVRMGRRYREGWNSIMRRSNSVNGGFSLNQ